MAKKLKKDFDRDRMYSKIMPSISLTDQKFEEEEFTVVKVEKKPSPLLPVYQEVGLQLHNYMEDMLREKLPHTMKVLHSCDCERCTMDIMAIALNELPCAYAVAEEDTAAERVKKLRREYEVKVTATLIKAIQQVKTKPRHGSQAAENKQAEKIKENPDAE